MRRTRTNRTTMRMGEMGSGSVEMEMEVAETSIETTVDERTIPHRLVALNEY